MSTSKRLRDLIEKSEYSYEQLETLSGVKKSSLQRYASGRTVKIPVDAIEKVAPFLGASASQIMGWDTPSLPPNAIPYTRGRKIPVLGSIPAGSPALAIETAEEYEYADVPDTGDYFFLRVKGDSMVGARIHDGDIVLIRQQTCANDGQIVACIVNGDEATLKRFYRQKDMIILKPENPSYAPLVVSCADFDSGYARILGVVMEVKFKP